MRQRRALLRPNQAPGDRGCRDLGARGSGRAGRARPGAGSWVHTGRMRTAPRRRIRGARASLEAPQPEGAGDDTVVPARNDLAEVVRAAPGQRVERVEDLELLVQAQERLQQVLLRPVEAVVLRPLQGVLP